MFVQMRGLSYGLEEEFIIPGNKIVTWLDATPVSDMQNWWQSLWFGSFYRTGDMDWIMHESLGWLYMSPSLHGGTWFWNEDLEWMWTDSLRFPFMFSNSRILGCIFMVITGIKNCFIITGMRNGL